MLLVLWAAFCFWAGFAFALVAASLIVAALIPAGLFAWITKGKGALWKVTRSFLVVLVTLGLATGALAIAGAVAPVPSCGAASVGPGGATSETSAVAGQCFVASAEICTARTLTVHETSVDEVATHEYRVVTGSDGECHFTDAVTYGPPSDPAQSATSYTCPALTDQVGAPGEQQVQLTQCTGAIASGVAAPIIPMNAYVPLPESG